MALTPEDKEEIRMLVKQATGESIKDTFRSMGIDPNNYEHLTELRDDLSWVRGYRKTAERVGSNFIVTLTTILTGSIVAAVWAYLSKP